jgi:hypothetical protein
MQELFDVLETVTPELERLEKQILGSPVEGKSATELLGENPQLGFSKLVEFKAVLDRMRAVTWVYMEAAAKSGNFPAQRIPQPLKHFLQEQAAKSRSQR